MSSLLPSHLPIVLLHADHDEDSFALRNQVFGDIAALPGASAYLWYEQGGNSRLPVDGVFPGEMDISHVDLPATPCTTCAAVPFMHEVRNTLLKNGVPPRDIQYEVFGPDLWQADYEWFCGPAVSGRVIVLRPCRSPAVGEVAGG